MKVLRGCDKEISGSMISGLRVKRCPLKVIGREVDVYVNAYFFFKSGFLPHYGGWADQPNKMIEAIMFIDGEFNRMADDGKRSAS